MATFFTTQYPLFPIFAESKQAWLIINFSADFIPLTQAEGLSWLPIVFSSGPVNGWNPFPDDAQAKVRCMRCCSDEIVSVIEDQFVSSTQQTARIAAFCALSSVAAVPVHSIKR